MPPEERDDYSIEVVSPGDRVAVQVLFVVVVAPVDADAADPKEVLELVEARDASGALYHDKAVRYLIAGCVAAPARTVWLPNEAD